MRIFWQIEGLNLEKLLRAAAREGIALSDVRRTQARCMTASVPAWQCRAFEKLCEQYGFLPQMVKASAGVRLIRAMRRRWPLAAGLLLGLALAYAGSLLVLRVEICGAGAHEAEVRRCLSREGVRVGRSLARISTDEVGTALALSVPGLAFAGVRMEGSVIVVQCAPATLGERAYAEGTLDIVAAQPGIITSIAALCGTPVVAPGDVVRRGQVLIRGEEQTEKGETRSIAAQGEVMAKCFAEGRAVIAMSEKQLLPTGRQRRTVALETPWGSRTLKTAQPYERGVSETKTEPVVGLFLPIFRKTVVYTEMRETEKMRTEAETKRLAERCAMQLAKKLTPAGSKILDNRTEYSIIESESVCAHAVIAYEAAIAGRLR